MEKDGGQVIIPTPALAEVLVATGDAAPAIMERLNRSSRILIADFDQLAAVELAVMTREALRAGDKFGGSTSPWQKVKIDRQIIAIARVNRADVILSDDDGVARFGSKLGLRVMKSWELPVPAVEHDLFTALSTEEGASTKEKSGDENGA